MWTYILVKLCRVCRRGDIKPLEDFILNSGSVCGRESAEEEITIPGHDGILKGDGGEIVCTLPEVR
jgi:hypothetical protein